MTVPPTTASGYQLWYYYPSIAGSVAVAVIFACLALVHLWFVVATHKKFCIPLVVGGVFEVVGYVCRAYAHSHTSATTPYAIQSMLILLAPILFAASVYMCLGRIIIFAQGEDQSLIPVRYLTKVFVCGDVLCFFIQAGGGGIMASSKTDSGQETGERLILAGMILQIIIFFFFVAATGTWHTRMQRMSSIQSGYELSWRHILVSLYAISVLITTRNLVRTVEYGIGSSGYLITHEWVIFVGDGVPMICVLAVSTIWYRLNIGGEARLINQDSYNQDNSNEMSVFIK
ncbi:RTA1-domain-containing protein [Limtongia smithiae]|uniref:RTA1-domain-containing protein n=1 Tax=Limtongia smithiae TaxID=1125753 RepID=UPI0034CED788